MALTDIVRDLLTEDESTTLDYKAARYPLDTEEQRGELIKDLLAFANTARGKDAFILLGVKEVQGGRSTVHGIASHHADAHLQQLVNDKTNRTLIFSYHAVELEGKQVGVLRIPPQVGPTYVRTDYGKLRANCVYVRRGSSTAILSPDEVARNFQPATSTIALSPAEHDALLQLRPRTLRGARRAPHQRHQPCAASLRHEYRTPPRLLHDRQRLTALVQPRV
jgi:predicted HTH transcriptional regulator